MNSILYIVATPIGTLGDFSPRAREILSQVAFIACEDTRHTAKLLSHFAIRTPTVALHEHNEAARSESLINRLLDSNPSSAAIVSDAGMPCISDPGSKFVAEARSKGVKILSVPGPSSLTCAVAASGFLQPRILFSGFLGRNTKDQEEEFKKWRQCAPAIAVFFESPNRVIDTLTRLQKSFGDTIQVCVSREISKQYEEHIHGEVHKVIDQLNAKESVMGECAICVDLNESFKLEEFAPREIGELAHEILNNPDDRSLKERSRILAEKYGHAAKDIYNRVQELKRETDSERD